jgi:hypothetical protein
MKRIRVALTALLVGGFMFATSSPAFAEQAFAEVTCAKGDGAEKTFAIGWDNSDPFFDGKGDIPRLYCEGGYSQPYNFYISDNLPADSPLRWYNGIAPELEPTPEPVEPEPVESIEPEPVPSVEPSLNPEPTPTPEPSQTATPEPRPIDTPSPTPEPTIEVSQTPSPTPEVTQTTEPVIEPTVEPEPAPTPKVSQIAPVPVVEPSPTPSESVQEVVQVSPEPTPSEIVAPDLAPDLVPAPEPVNDQVVTLDVPSALAGVPGIVALFQAAEAFMNIGSDMTDEQREESQSVVVAAVIVGQIAMRKTK